MKTLIVAAAASVAIACAPAEHPVTATCTPVVNVTIPRANVRTAASERRSEVVQVYWDISKSMRDFRRTSDDLGRVVRALDSEVLLQSHARSVEQFGVGESIVSLSSARSALSPNANR